MDPIIISNSLYCFKLFWLSQTGFHHANSNMAPSGLRENIILTIDGTNPWQMGETQCQRETATPWEDHTHQCEVMCPLSMCRGGKGPSWSGSSRVLLKIECMDILQNLIPDMVQLEFT